MGSMRKERRKSVPGLLDSGGARMESGPNRLMERPLLEQRRRSTAAVELER